MTKWVTLMGVIRYSMLSNIEALISLHNKNEYNKPQK